MSPGTPAATRPRLGAIFSKPSQQPDAVTAPAASAPTAPDPPATAVRPVTVYLPRGLGERARSVCRNRDLTWTELTIEAVNAHATAIAAALHPSTADTAAAAVVPARQPRAGGRRGRIPGGRLEVQLRLDGAQLAGLDRQIALSGAMNRSHYVTAALQLHLGDAAL
ncbi:MAG: hypothetical protein E6Q93_14000 [Burkholderiaceae bacterium]|nr:MAG: hypothetical protein E6Q93_14000 [Burkholderiaceae bacterium]